MIKKICFITDRYPTPEYPMNTFLDQLVCQFADMGLECTVIAPYSRILDKMKKNNYHPAEQYKKITSTGKTINVYCPTIFALTGRKIGPLNFGKIYQYLYNRAVKHVIQGIMIEPDAFYGHFITPAGIAAVEMGRMFHKPSYIAYGECFIEQDSCIFSIPEIKNKMAGINGIVAVSTKNKDELLRYEIVKPEQVDVFPNAVNTDRFYKIDRQEARKSLGYNPDDFIVAFMGHFIERKGVLRVSRALKDTEGIKSIFIGDGPQVPDCPGILFKGRLPHDKIVTYLNAADVFVLPTLAEGCCNAIVEAMACGLPIISSDLPFNDDILDESNSIRIDPMNIQAISDAIKTLCKDQLKRKLLSEGSLQKAKGLTIESRAIRIIDFLEEKAIAK